MNIKGLANALQEFILDRKMNESKEYKRLIRKSNLSLKELEYAIEKISDIKVREEIKSLFGEYQDKEGEKICFEIIFAYENGVLVGDTFHTLKKI